MAIWNSSVVTSVEIVNLCGSNVNLLEGFSSRFH